jgi:hypothetical protein
MARHDLPLPANPNGTFPLGIANAAPAVVTEGDACALSMTLARRVRVDSVGGSPASGFDALHNTFTQAALAGGTSTETVYTVPAARYARITSVTARYIGTVLGVTLQVLAGTLRGDIAASGLVSAIDVNLLGAGRVLFLDTTETLQVVITGATGGDDLIVVVQGEELTV